MRKLHRLFEQNRNWVRDVKQGDPGFFDRLAAQQSPQLLWIGCSDSRAPASQLVGLVPGEVFEHRNVANLVVHTDLNCLSVLQFAVDVLRVRHVVVCGHYRCGGVTAALGRERHGLIDNWLRHVIDVVEKHRACLDAIADEQLRNDRLSELNVIEQVHNLYQTSIVQDAWAAGHELTVHGWIYNVGNGLLRDLDLCVDQAEEAEPAYQRALAGLIKRGGPPLVEPS